MSFYGATIRDALGTLGGGSSARIARIVYDGILQPSQTVHVPDFDVNAGIIFRYQNGNPILGGSFTFNNTTKILKNDGAVDCQYFLYTFAGQKTYVPGSYGLTITNNNDEVVIDNRNRNAEIVAQGTVNISGTHAVQSVSFPAVDYPQVFVRMPYDVYIYVGKPTSVGVSFSAESATTFDYFITGFRQNDSGLSSGHHLTFRDSGGRVVFHSARPYARIYGSYFVPPYDVFDTARAPPNDFQWQMNPAPINSYVALAPMFRLPSGGGQYAYGLKRLQNVGGYDYFRTFRFTMDTAVASAIGLIPNPNTSTLYFKQFFFVGSPS